MQFLSSLLWRAQLDTNLTPRRCLKKDCLVEWRRACCRFQELFMKTSENAIILWKSMKLGSCHRGCPEARLGKESRGHRVMREVARETSNASVAETKQKGFASLHGRPYLRIKYRMRIEKLPLDFFLTFSHFYLGKTSNFINFCRTAGKNSFYSKQQGTAIRTYWQTSQPNSPHFIPVSWHTGQRDLPCDSFWLTSDPSVKKPIGLLDTRVKGW